MNPLLLPCDAIHVEMSVEDDGSVAVEWHEANAASEYCASWSMTVSSDRREVNVRHESSGPFDEKSVGVIETLRHVLKYQSGVNVHVHLFHD